MTLLPIDAIKTDLLASVQQHQTLVLTAPPGAGKSTRLPLWLLADDVFADQKIYLLQPRRVAAKNIAIFLAQQLGEEVGQSVGYRLKNETKVSSHTRLEVITEGILTQIIQHDPELDGVALILFDEFHERSLHGDLAFALARDIQQGLRDDLTLMLMSATLASDNLLAALADAKSLVSEGRSFPVDISYQVASVGKQWLDHLVAVILAEIVPANSEQEQSSILVFLPGVAVINQLAERLDGHIPAHIQVLKLYGQLSLKEQQTVIAPANKGFAKIVLATNIAETSLTIDGVDLVIDSGLEKVATYYPDILTNHLVQRKTSKASAIQRAGRAGRLKAGRCIRLYSEEDYGRRIEHATSEIHHGDILPLVLESARWGVTALKELPLIELPSDLREQQAWQELHALALVNANRQLTLLGQQVAALACHPRFGRMIIQAQALEKLHQRAGLLALACVIAAMLEEKDMFSGEQARFDCDLSHRIDALLSKKPYGLAQRIERQASRLYQQVSQHSLRLTTKLPVADIGILLALAYPERLAKARAKYGDFFTVPGKGLTINDQDALAGEDYIVAAHVTSVKSGNLIVRLAAKVDINQLLDWQIITAQTEQVLSFDDSQGRIIAGQQSKVGALVLQEKPQSSALQGDQLALLWCQQVSKHGLTWLRFSENTKALLQRWRWVNEHLAQCQLPAADDDNLLNCLDAWFSPYVGEITSKKALLQLDFSAMLLSLMSYQQQQLFKQVAPSYFIGPTGRKCSVRYGQQQSPTLSLPMQEVYGMQQSPCVGVTSDIARDYAELLAEQVNCQINDLSAIPLTLELLSPAQRPIQITQDLATFWQGSYLAVQKDMKARYPKHFWPDDPANAQPTNKTKRYM